MSGLSGPMPCAAAGDAAASTNNKGKAWRGNNILEKNRAAMILTR